MMFLIFKHTKVTFGKLKECFLFYLKGINSNIANINVKKKRFISDGLFFKVVSILINFIVTDVVLITLHITKGYFCHGLLGLIVLWTIILLLGFNLLTNFDKLNNISNEIFNRIENYFKISILRESSLQCFYDSNIMANHHFQSLEYGLEPFISIVLYPLRLFLLGSIICGSYYTSIFISLKFIIFSFISLAFEVMTYKLFIIPEKESISEKIEELFENIQSILILKNHEEQYLNMFNSEVSSVNFVKSCYRSLLSLLQFSCLFYFVFDIISSIKEDLKSTTQDIDKDEKCFILFLSLSLYLIDSTKITKSIASYIISYNYIRKTNSNKYEYQVLTNVVTESRMNNLDDLNLELKSLPDSIKSNECNSTIVDEDIESQSLKHDYCNSYNTTKYKHKFYSNDMKHRKNGITTYITSSKPYEMEDSSILMTTDDNSPMSTSFSSPEKTDGKKVLEISNISIFCLNTNKRKFLAHQDKFTFNFINCPSLSIKKSNTSFKCKRQENKNAANKCNTNNILRNINISVGKNDFLVIFGPNNCGKTLLTKYLSNFPEVFSNGYLQIEESENNSKVYLLNKKMLDLVSNICEYNKFRPQIDLLEFILSGKPFEKNIFDLVFKLLSFGEYYRCEPLQTHEIEKKQGREPISVIKLHPIIGTQQSCNEAKICLQLFQFLYSILYLHKNTQNSIIIIDDIFDLLLPSTSLRIICDIISDDSLLVFKDLSFIITINESLEPFFSQLLSRENPRLKLISLNGNGTANIYKYHDYNQSIEKNMYMMNTIPRINLDVSNPHSKQEIDTSIYSFEESPFSSNEINLGQIENEKHVNKKHEIFVLVLGIFSFFIKLNIFSNFNGFESNSGLHVFPILLFSSLFSQINFDKNLIMNELSNVIFGLFVISTTLFGRSDPIYNRQPFEGSKNNFNGIGKFEKLIPSIHYNSTFFLEFNGNQILKNTSLFYKENYYNEKVSIPGINPKGFRDAILVSKLIEQKFGLLGDNIKENVTPLEQVLLQFIPKPDFLVLVKIFTIFYIIDIILKIIIRLFISSIKNRGYFYEIKNKLFTLISSVESTKDPISSINNIYMRKNTFSNQIFDESSHSKDTLPEYYFSTIISISSLLVFNLPDIYAGNIFLVIVNIFFISFMLSITCKLLEYFVINLQDLSNKSPIINCDSFDLLHYLRKIEITEWFGSLLTNSINLRYKLLELRNAHIIKIYVYLMLPIFFISLTTIITINKSNSHEFNSKFSLLISLLLLFSRSILSRELFSSSKKNISILRVFQRRIKNYFDKTNYSKIKINLSSLSPSSTRTERSHHSNSSIISYLRNIEIEFSSPFQRKLQENNFSTQREDVKKSINGINIFTVNPLTFSEKSYSYGFGCSLLFPFKHENIKIGSILDKIGIISNYNLVPLKWRIGMILDPKKIFKYESKLIYRILKSFELIPQYCQESEIEYILDLSLENYCEFIMGNFDTKQVFSEFETKFSKESTINRDILEIYNKSRTLGNFGNYNLFISSNISNIQKLLLLVHFILYCRYYQTLVIHLNYNMNHESWLLFIREYIVNCKDSSIKNIILVHSVDSSSLK
ncbi:hypothetical protein FG379_002664 [Cryptosporidium bovis]|uniref:uncharacterized protein n=1 Tax=Cryptosporidium bovis TaxID=310047 RepID=UPI00351A3BF4|nr:hypothetical protein FG379_002664 [Cryptosporidium bovis]